MLGVCGTSLVLPGWLVKSVKISVFNVQVLKDALNAILHLVCICDVKMPRFTLHLDSQVGWPIQGGLIV